MACVVSINVNGLNDPRRSDSILRHLYSLKLDILFLQETHLNPVNVNNVFSQWPGTSFHSFGKDNRKGVSILISDRLKTTIHSRHTSDTGHLIVLDLSIDDNRLILSNVYAPTGGLDCIANRKEFFNELNKVLDNFPHDFPIILGGDFNCVLDPSDRSNPVNYVEKTANNLKAVLSSHALEDIWRIQNPSSKEFTFSSSRGSFSRIDKFYTSRNFRDIFNKPRIDTFPHSDHDRISLSLNFSAPKRGTGIWKLNTCILKEQEFINSINQFITDWEKSQESFPSLTEWWEHGKNTFVDIAKTYSRDRKKHFLRKKSKLLKQLRNAKRKAESSGDPRFQKLYKNISNEVKSLEASEAEGVKIRSKAKWSEQGEKVTRYFCSLEKKRQSDRTMKSIKDKHVNSISDPTEIVNVVKEFYASLYKEEPVDSNLQDTLLQKISKRLSETEKNICEHPLTLEEINTALKTMVNGKSPGIDGLPCEFYKLFWKSLGKHFLNVINSCFDNKSLTPSQRIALISCLFKKGDRENIKNWRPLSLLNCDYKIIAKVLANRLSKVLTSIIAEDQTCSVPGRSILGNCHALRDIIQFSENENLPVALLSIDQMKAFDRVNWNFLLKTLEKFNFGPVFISWVKLLYTNIESKVKCNDFISDPFTPSRGVRQGCPLSALLYVLIAEVFAANVRCDPAIKGVTVGKTEFKIIQYADDTTLLLQGNQSSLAIENHIANYEKASGAKINKDKSEGLWLGSFKNRPDSPLGFNWKKKTLKILGLYFGTEDTNKLNWEPKVSKFIKTLDLWKSRDLTFRGKAVVVNQLASSALWYTASVFPIPQWAVKQLNEKLWHFFFNGKRPPIPRSQAKLPYQEGGLNVLDIEKKCNSLLLSWLAKLVAPEQTGKWKVLFDHFLGKYKNLNIGKNILKCYLQSREINKLPPFYKHTLRAYLAITNDHNRSLDNMFEIFNEPLFLNPKIAKDSLPLNPYWVDAGITLLRDITYEFSPGFLPELAINELVGSKFKPKDLFSILSCLPLEWKNFIRSNSAPKDRFSINFTPPIKDIKKPLCKLSSKDLYLASLMSSTDVSSQKFRVYWEKKFSDLDWKFILKSIFTRDSDRKSCDLQWKIIQLAIPTADRLARHKIIDNPLCPRCNNHNETTLHLFMHCRLVSLLWDTVLSHIKNLDLDLNLDSLEQFIVIAFASIKPSPIYSPAIALRDIALLAVWSSRNKLVFDNESIDPSKIFTAKLRSKIKEEFFLVKSSFAGLFNFKTTWCRNNVLASVVDDKLFIHC